ncbi:MAG: short-chain dehydrogenase/reductase [Deltaproteobacteria bacterium]|nr:short-chain dehydrogenase/reductase [Deltaproteobacteria bacterium]
MYKKLFSCKNKVAVVTGGLGLIGREIAVALNEFDAKVFIADLGKNSQSIIKGKTNIELIYFDITSETIMSKAMNTIIKRYGKIDIFINSAYPKTKDWGKKLEKIPFESWKTNVNDHLGGYFLSSRMAAEAMKKSGGGTIINIASIYGMVGPDFSIYENTDITMPAAYSAIKGGIISFTKYLATYCAENNIRANVISPGGILDRQPESFIQKYAKKTPLGRMGCPIDITGAAIFLSSDASSYITGQNIVVDGGWTAW